MVAAPINRTRAKPVNTKTSDPTRVASLAPPARLRAWVQASPAFLPRGGASRLISFSYPDPDRLNLRLTDAPGCDSSSVRHDVGGELVGGRLRVVGLVAGTARWRPTLPRWQARRAPARSR
jgi:hypothetical protein